jgi:hypothetical protein
MKQGLVVIRKEGGRGIASATVHQSRRSHVVRWVVRVDRRRNFDPKWWILAFHLFTGVIRGNFLHNEDTLLSEDDRSAYMSLLKY